VTELGPVLLTAAFVLAGAGLTASLIGRRSFAQRTNLGAVIMVWATVVVLMEHMVGQRYEFAYVASNIAPWMSTPLRLAAAWAGSEGSMLVFTAITLSVLVATTWTKDNAKAASSTSRFETASVRVATTGAVGVGLLAASLFAAPPFDRLAQPPLTGEGITPILDHWAMLIHPPLLYLGMALALAPVLLPESKRRRSIHLASGVITVALLLGSAWAYVELGWGGWWAWDPVENVALIIWLLLVGALHSPARTKASTALLAATWPAVFGGTALTRTSLRTSVHAFADSGSLGLVLWPLAALCAAGALTLVWATARAKRSPLTRTPLTRTSQARARLPKTRRAPVALLTLATLIVAIGTYRPFIGSITSGQDITAGWFYTKLLAPLTVIGLIAMITTGRRKGRTRLQLITNVLIGATAGVLIVLAASGSVVQLFIAGCLGASFVAQAADVRATTTRLIAHLGIGLLVLGALAGTFATRDTFRLRDGGSAVIAGYSIRHIETKVLPATNIGPNQIDAPIVVEATFTVDGKRVRPTIGVRPALGTRLAEARTIVRIGGDVQLLLRDADDDGVLVDINVHPLQWTVWLGAVLIAAASFGALLPRAAPTKPASSKQDASKKSVVVGE